MSRHVYTLKKPAAWHKERWREALPLGNGLTGALIPGAVGEETVTFNRFDLWEDGEDPPIPDVTAALRAQREALDRGDGAARTHTLEILDFGGQETAYWQLLYDRIPTLPQSLHRDFGVISHLWQNIAHRVARTGKQ